MKLRTPDGKLLDHCKNNLNSCLVTKSFHVMAAHCFLLPDDDYKCLFINKTGKLSLEVHISDIRNAILEDASNSKD